MDTIEKFCQMHIPNWPVVCKQYYVQCNYGTSMERTSRLSVDRLVHSTLMSIAALCRHDLSVRITHWRYWVDSPGEPSHPKQYKDSTGGCQEWWRLFWNMENHPLATGLTPPNRLRMVTIVSHHSLGNTVMKGLYPTSSPLSHRVLWSFKRAKQRKPYTILDIPWWLFPEGS